MQRQAIPQRKYLLGIKNIINALKQLQFSKHPGLNATLKIYNGVMLKHHLPSGICKGYALMFARNRTTSDMSGFESRYQDTTSLAEYSIADLKEWILKNQDAAYDLLSFNGELLMNHRIKTIYPDHFNTDFISTGMHHQAALTVNLAPHELAGMINKHILSHLNLPNDPNTIPQQFACLLISNGNHMVSVNVRFRFGKILFRLNDANDTFSFETDNLDQLCGKINESFELVNQYDGQCISYQINVLTEKTDPVFDDILKRLKYYVAILPDILPDEVAINTNKSILTQELPHKKLLQKLIENYEKGQSRVGFFQDLFLYYIDPVLSKSRKYELPLQAEILKYLSNQPSMKAVLFDYRHRINQPSRNGYTWLHQALMTNEKHVVWWLMHQYRADPNLKPLFRPLLRAKESLISIENDQSCAVIRGTGEDPKLLRDDEEVKIIDSHFVHSHPLHYAALADDLDLLSWLQAHGANVDLPAGNGKTARELVKSGGHINPQPARQATPSDTGYPPFFRPASRGDAGSQLLSEFIQFTQRP